MELILGIYFLGLMYEKGIGVQANASLAIEKYESLTKEKLSNISENDLYPYQNAEIRLGLMYTPFEDMHNIVRVILVGPLTKIGGTYWGALVVTLLIHLLWMTGIHGAALIMGIISPVTYKLMAENNAAYMAGARGSELPNVVTTQFFDIFQSMGG